MGTPAMAASTLTAVCSSSGMSRTYNVPTSAVSPTLLTVWGMTNMLTMTCIATMTWWSVPGEGDARMGDAEDRGLARRPVRLSAHLTDLEAARAVVNVTDGLTLATFGTVDASVGLSDRPERIRRLLTDALAQLDAIEP